MVTVQRVVSREVFCALFAQNPEGRKRQIACFSQFVCIMLLFAPQV